MTVFIRAAEPADLPFIVGLIEADSMIGSTEDASDPMGADYRAAFAAITADPNQHLLIGEIEGQRVGTFQMSFVAGISRKGAWRCTIESVHVAPSHRNKRIGETMMAWAVEQARDRKCALVQLTSHKKRADAHRFYERIGFARSHEGFKLSL